MKKKIISMLLVFTLCLPLVMGLTSCKDKKETKDTFVIMTETLDGLFNPFFSTSANDSTIISMTQIGMLSSKLNEAGEAVVAFGENEATATLDYMEETKTVNGKTETVYTFVLKNGILFSDGHPLTMEDVLFNMYIYLDPIYTGSATMYSTDIKGLAAYRNQQFNISDDSDTESEINEDAAARAQMRLDVLAQLYYLTDEHSPNDEETNEVDEATMRDAIASCPVDYDYLAAIFTTAEIDEMNAEGTTEATFRKCLLADYELALKYFKEELENDFKNAKDSYTEDPYKSHKEFEDEVFCFMYLEGFITPEYAKIEGTNKDDKSKIIGFNYNYDNDNIKTKDQAISKVYNDTVTNKLDYILYIWATGTKLVTEYTAKAKEVILRDGVSSDGNLVVEKIEGIVSLGHPVAWGPKDSNGNAIKSEPTVNEVVVNGTTYKVAHEHNSDGTPKNEGEYDVLQITVNGVDPKAVWNFAFSVAPQHYYGEASKGAGITSPVDLANNKFGVEYASFEFMKNTVQSIKNNRLPMGAGVYKVTNSGNDDDPKENEFYSGNIVYFKSNENFKTVGTGLHNANIKKVRYQVVSATNALDFLEKGSVDYVTPQYSKENFARIQNLTNSHYESLVTKQLGYGYIGINASKINNLHLRRAIMSAMNTSLAIQFYAAGTAETIYYPMSTVSWAYPKDEDGNPSTDNGKSYPQIGAFDAELAKQNILDEMSKAGVNAGDSRLKIIFTIAGTNLQDHPTYAVFSDAAKLLNECGWEISVEPDQNALTKLATGSLTVWAAAWGSTIDPDMYQVYHKNSTATSVLAWGYPYLKNGTAEEVAILNRLSEKIEAAREITDRNERSAIYESAMKDVLDLAIELPVYQRSSVYVYNTDVIDPATVPSTINPYSSPLDRIWELDFKK